MGMQVVCMVKRSLAGHIEDVDYAAVARGPLGAVCRCAKYWPSVSFSF